MGKRSTHRHVPCWKMYHSQRYRIFKCQGYRRRNNQDVTSAADINYFRLQYAGGYFWIALAEKCKSLKMIIILFECTFFSAFCTVAVCIFTANIKTTIPYWFQNFQLHSLGSDCVKPTAWWVVHPHPQFHIGFQDPCVTRSLLVVFLLGKEHSTIPPAQSLDSHSSFSTYVKPLLI